MRDLIARNLRWLLRRPTYTVSVMTAMTLGLALLAIVASAYSAFMWRPLGIDNAEELVRVRELKPGGGSGVESTLNVSPAVFHLWRQRELPFTDMALSTGRELSLTSGDRPERLDVAAVTSNLFDVLGIAPAAGRNFAEGEDTAGRDDVVILSHAFWQQRYDADREIIGSSIELDGNRKTVIGIMPEGFSYPNDAQVWIPEVLGDEINEAGHWTYNVVARLQPGLSLTQATERMSDVAARVTGERPDVSQTPGAFLVEFRQELLAGMDSVLLVLLAGSLFVVLISTLNVANITLSRAVHERRDDAVRLAMGARRSSLFQNAAIRALAVMTASTGLAFYVASFATVPFSGLRGLSALDQFPTEMRMDSAAILLTVGVALLATLIIATGSLWLQRQGDLHGALSGGNKGSGGTQRTPLMSGLTVLQIAMSLVLLLGAVLVGGSYRHLMNQDRGFDDRNLLVANVSLTSEKYPDAAAKERFLAAALANLEAIPGVGQASSATTTPARAGSWGAVFIVEGQAPPEPRGYHITSHRFVSDDYFETMKIPLLEGRIFDDRDHREGVHRAIVSREFAERFWPGESAVGKRVRRGDQDADRPWMTIVGVAENVAEAGESTLWDKSLQWYLPTSLGTDYDFAETFLLVSTDGQVPGIGQAIREAVWAADPMMGIEQVAPIRQLMAETFERERYSAMLFAMFGIVSLVISIVGLYGFLAFRTAMQRPEFGIRMALGALPEQVRMGVLGHSMRMFAIGLIISLPFCFMLVRAVKSSLYGIDTSGLAEFAAVSLVLMATCLLASFVPAARAASVEPMVVLRTE